MSLSTIVGGLHRRQDASNGEWSFAQKMKNSGNKARVCCSCDVLLYRWSTNLCPWYSVILYVFSVVLTRTQNPPLVISMGTFSETVRRDLHIRAPFSGPHSHLKWFISSSRFLNSPCFPGIKLPLESMIFAGLEMVVQILQSVWYNHSPARQKNQRWIDMCFYFVRYSHAFVQDLLLYLTDNLELFFWNPVSCRCLSQTTSFYDSMQRNGPAASPKLQ